MGPTARELFLTILCPSARFQRRATGGKRLSMPLSGMKSVRWQTSGEKTFLRVVWWLRHGASTSTRSKVRNGEVRGSYIKPSRLYLSLKHCRPNKNYGVGGSLWGVSMKLQELLVHINHFLREAAKATWAGGACWGLTWQSPSYNGVFLLPDDMGL